MTNTRQEKYKSGLFNFADKYLKKSKP